MKTPALLLALTVAALAQPPFPPGEIRQPAPPVGRLGYPIGTYLTIEGKRAEQGKSGTQSLLVDKIGETKVEKPFGLWIENLELPAGERVVLKGYESGAWIGTPESVVEGTGVLPPQAAWQFHFHFLVTSVDQPKTLKRQAP